MMFHRLLSLVALWAALKSCGARSWRHIETFHVAVTPYDDLFADAVLESDPFMFTPSPTISPSQDPTEMPPTMLPTLQPTKQTPLPTDTVPTFSPTQSAYPENEIPLDPPTSYFNYDSSRDSEYGPGYQALVQNPNGGFMVKFQNNAWADWVPPPDFYWNEFSENGFGAWKGVLEEHRMSETNQCGNVGRQSPIDIRMSGVACVEHHQIRSRRGDHGLRGAGVQRLIESNKLRLVYQRRPCADLLNIACAEPDPPHADFPNGWGGFADVVHVDFKLPAEHRLYGQRFDAEMQIYAIHPERRLLPVTSVLMKAEEGAFNSYLQIAIEAFQEESNSHRADCAEKFQRNLRENKGSYEIHEDIFHPHGIDFFLSLAREESRNTTSWSRQLQSNIWSPFHVDMTPSYYFFGYDGSLTEPPCSEIVSWFVLDKPLIVGKGQIDQMKNILFNHVDSSCRRTSVHKAESVARPIQDSLGRQVWHCNEQHYLPDHLRDPGA